jgi:hypothetical protein
MEKVIKKLIKELEKEVKQLGKDNWEYHRDILIEAGFKKKEEVLINDLDLDCQGWEDVAFICGEIYGIERVMSMLEELVKDNK